MELITGKNNTQRIVSCEVLDNQTLLFIQDDNGNITQEAIPNIFWILSSRKLDDNFTSLKGDLHYKYVRKFYSAEEHQKFKKIYRDKDIYSVYDNKESAMLTQGFTYFKGMKVNDVSTLSFDLETTSLEHTSDAKVLLISNTLRKNGLVTRRLFSYDDYDDNGAMINAWCEWVRDADPSVILGHNIYSYDLPYLTFVASKYNLQLELGRDSSAITFNPFQSKFRKDATQFYDYTKAYIFGREIIDTFFLSIKYDVGRKYESYKLKTIIEQEGLEVKNRQHYDASTIRFNYTNPVEWKKIKQYAIHDADDALALYDLMIPAFFYLNQTVPTTFENIINKASGSQINMMMMRSYLQKFHSLPNKSISEDYEGAISFGNPGIYHNCYKIDVASLYPSIMRYYKVYDEVKDPQQNFLKLVEYFTIERLKNKKLAAETNDRYYNDLQNAQKIIINSMYGFLGAEGLLFNSPKKAAFITEKGREILEGAINWAKTNNYDVINADTDSILFNKKDKPILEEERKDCLTKVNTLYPELIRFEDDGYYKHVLVIKAKNYILDDGKKRKTKGSALKATTKEKALKEFIDDTITALLNKKKDQMLHLYHRYVREIHNVKDISRWTSKKTITENVLNAERLNEQKVLDAIDGTEYQMSDKIYVYFDNEDKLKLQENWNADHNKDRLLKKLYNTLYIFETVLDVDCFPDYTLKRNKEFLEEVYRYVI